MVLFKFHEADSRDGGKLVSDVTTICLYGFTSDRKSIIIRTLFPAIANFCKSQQSIQKVPYPGGSSRQIVEKYRKQINDNPAPRVSLHPSP